MNFIGMKNLININILAVVVLFWSCDNNDCLQGGGSSQEINLELSNFEDISVGGAINIELTQGATFETFLVVEPELIPALKFGVENNELYVTTRNGECIRSSRTMILKVTAPNFDEISVAGQSVISSVGDLDLERLVLSVAGSAESNISGFATRQVFQIDGSADINHFGLDSNESEITINGSGNLELIAEEVLDITVNGSAVIKYKGAPQITQDISGSLDLINAN